MNEALPDVPEVRVVGLPQLTSGFDLVERLDLPMHLKVHGPLEPMGGEQLAKLSEAINLKGRGGAGFPFHKKLRSVAEAAIKRGVRPVVVVNGSEDEPACRKDTVLINRAPHLILDGALLAAEALGARTLVVGVTRESTQRSMEAALAERGLSNGRRSALRARVQRNPVRMVTGAAASLIRSIDGGPAIPPGRKISASQSGVGGAPTLLSNAETFAQLAIAARIGPAIEDMAAKSVTPWWLIQCQSCLARKGFSRIAAFSAVSAIREMPMIVTSSPSRRIAALPNCSTWSSSSGTSRART